ncbi:MAG: hypothetical protein EZS28_039572, partial [Streblomastix strix]
MPKKKGQKVKTKPTPEQIEQMRINGQTDRVRQLNYYKGRTAQMAMIPKIMKQHNMRVPRHMTEAQIKEYARQLRQYDPTLSEGDVQVALRALPTLEHRRGIFGTNFSNEQAEELMELEIRVNNE